MNMNCLMPLLLNKKRKPLLMSKLVERGCGSESEVAMQKPNAHKLLHITHVNKEGVPILPLDAQVVFRRACAALGKTKV